MVFALTLFRFKWTIFNTNSICFDHTILSKELILTEYICQNISKTVFVKTWTEKLLFEFTFSFLTLKFEEWKTQNSFLQIFYELFKTIYFMPTSQTENTKLETLLTFLFMKTVINYAATFLISHNVWSTPQSSCFSSCLLWVLLLCDSIIFQTNNQVETKHKVTKRSPDLFNFPDWKII